MLDEKMIKWLYVNVTLEEILAEPKRNGVPLSGEWAPLEQARELFERGAVQQACDILAGIVINSPVSRTKLLAAKVLRDRGVVPGGPDATIAQGIVIEMPMEGGKDVLAVYRDGTARFFSYAGRAVIYEAPDIVGDQLCRQIITVADQIITAPKGTAFPDDGTSPHVTVLTLSGEVRAGSASPLDPLLRLGALFIGRLAKMTRSSQQARSVANPGVVCPRCGFQNRPGAKYCQRDGQPL